jgi:hypothetical protein
MKAARLKAKSVAIGSMPHHSLTNALDARQENARKVLEELSPTAVIAYEIETALPSITQRATWVGMCRNNFHCYLSQRLERFSASDSPPCATWRGTGRCCRPNVGRAH